MLVRGAREAVQWAAPPALARFGACWPRRAARARGAPAPSRPTALPVLRWLPVAIREMRTRGDPLAEVLARAAPRLRWRQTYGAGEVGARFLANYAWSELIGSGGPFRSRILACGLLLLGPRTHYPRHRHPAEELYLPLAGTAAWQRGSAQGRRVPPGRPILHRSGQPHAIRTGRAPLLALYVWRGAGLSQRARLDGGKPGD